MPETITKLLLAACRARAAPAAPRSGSRSRRSRGTSGPPGRTGSPSWSARASSVDIVGSSRISCDLGRGSRCGERLALDLGEGDGVDQEACRGSAAPAGRRFISGTRTRSKRARTSPRLRGNGLRWRRCSVADLQALARAPAFTGAGDRAVGRAPAEHQQVAGRRRRRPRARGSSSAIRSTFSARSRVICSWFVGVVGDVAGAVLLLEAADAVLEARRAGDRPGAGQGLRVAGVGLEALGLRCGSRPGGPAGRRRRGSCQGSEPLAM